MLPVWLPWGWYGHLGDWNINFTEYSWMVCLRYVRACVRLGYAHGWIPYIRMVSLISGPWCLQLVELWTQMYDQCEVGSWRREHWIAVGPMGAVSEPSGSSTIKEGLLKHLAVLLLKLNGFHIYLFKLQSRDGDRSRSRDAIHTVSNEISYIAYYEADNNEFP